MSYYELAILGAPSAQERATLEASLCASLQEFGLDLGREFAIRDSGTLSDRDPKAPLSACFFVTASVPTDAELKAAEQVIAADSPIIPTIDAAGNFGHTPATFAAANGLRRRRNDDRMEELAAAMLECVGLLRSQRRVFVSYRRTDSRAVALQLHDELCARGFDVFLDTHDIRPGQPFQEVLWHRLCDSDIMLMLDTPGYFDSKWTSQEIGRARAKDIQVFRVVWPGHNPTRFTDISDTTYLVPDDFENDQLVAQSLDQIALKVESLRSRSLAARHRLMSGKLAAEAERVGGLVEPAGAHRAMPIRLAGGRRIWAYPVIGIPTAELLHDIIEKFRRAEQDGAPALVYDHVGLRQRWLEHLEWLGDRITDAHWIRVTEAAWTLAGLEEGHG